MESRFKIDKMVTQTYKSHELQDAFDKAIEAKEMIKVMVDLT